MKQLAGLIIVMLSLMAGQTTFAKPKDNQHPHDPSFEQDRHGQGDERQKNDKGRGQGKKQQRHNAPLKAGQALPEEFRHAERVDYRDHRQLSEPSRYQQWVKVNDRFVLMNVLTNTILKVE
ncbi:regulator RcnB of Ni and Co efflux [Acinetobacter marinus]|uniref:Regulator RcnB of Ni and Co efflux n=1 Tax=Acinetobacter marinus TaxID=281375 RepID=A0A1G6NZA3_9GAMM|nr:RcnB family protein [Acinetobacter marinus]SDC72684.1 regulator RcnB of Ni and Co efflux [Acinetobacter marinus]